ncbi:hypothetical protein BaRGS_00025663, partial [Batillaria attramentaria]
MKASSVQEVGVGGGGSKRFHEPMGRGQTALKLLRASDSRTETATVTDRAHLNHFTTDIADVGLSEWACVDFWRAKAAGEWSSNLAIQLTGARSGGK